MSVQQRVDVVALGEHPAVLVQPVDLAQRPVEVVVVTAVEDPVDREVRAEVAAAEHIGLGPEAQVLQSPGRDPTAAGEQPRADHAAGVEVVALVPPVVRDLVTAVRFDHREQHRPEADFAAQVCVGHFSIP